MEPVVVALDFETADYRPDSACSLGMVRLRNGQVEDTLYRLIRPPRRRIYFTHIHGITWPMVQDCPTFAEQWPSFDAFWQDADYLIAHNATFDRGVLQGCCAAMGLEVPKQRFLCTLKGSRRGLHLPHNRLNDLCTYLGIALDHHNALSDALAAAHIYLHLRGHGLPLEAMLLN